MDHNVIRLKNAQCLYLSNGNSGSTNSYGHATWAKPSDWGGPTFFFVEDNYISYSDGGDLTDGNAGMKVVVRHNHVYNNDFANHGTEGTERGGRAMEVYANDFHALNGNRNFVGGTRSGGILFYNNNWSADSVALTGDWSMAVFREAICNTNQQFTGWEGASGKCPWDVNDTEGNGSYVEGHLPWQYWPTGQNSLPLASRSFATAGTGSTLGKGGFAGNSSAGDGAQVVDSGSPGWSVGQFQGYQVVDLGDGTTARDYNNQISGALSDGKTLAIINTTIFDVLNLTPWGPGTQINNPPAAIGEHYQIYRPLACLDQEGRGQGDLIGGAANAFVNQVTGTRAWPHQVLDPVYAWNNHELRSGKYVGVHSG
jgi:hypothetical protein